MGQAISNTAYHSEGIPLSLPPSARLPKPPSEAVAVPAICLFTPSQTTRRRLVPSRLYAHSSHAAITLDLEIESTHFVSGSAPGIRAHSTEPHLPPFTLPPAPTRSQPPGVLRVVAYGYDSSSIVPASTKQLELTATYYRVPCDKSVACGIWYYRDS